MPRIAWFTKESDPPLTAFLFHSVKVRVTIQGHLIAWKCISTKQRGDNMLCWPVSHETHFKEQKPGVITAFSNHHGGQSRRWFPKLQEEPWSSLVSVQQCSASCLGLGTNPLFSLKERKACQLEYQLQPSKQNLLLYCHRMPVDL